ncbi:hypothetical protein JCM24511_06263 [Saitozyma sp. JCM 24511]|nr:hypothetical protein JCM24511_06263 [Saitozyma sp. JCM 24511]
MSTFEPPPPYSPSAQSPPQAFRPLPQSARPGPSRPRRRASLSTLPLSILHSIIAYTLDPKATPSLFRADSHEEWVRRVWGMFRGLRGVDRRFYLVSTSLLRELYHPAYLSALRGASTDAFPHDSPLDPGPDGGGDATIQSQSVFARRGRETAVFDRWIAVRVGSELRQVESSLSEEGEAEEDVIKRLQPVARIEDLLLTLPPRLISPQPETGSSPPPRSLPLPHSHLSINLTPGWAQVYLHPRPYTAGGGGRELVLEVRRQKDAEGSVRRIGDGLEDLQRGLVSWGGRVG